MEQEVGLQDSRPKLQSLVIDLLQQELQVLKELQRIKPHSDFTRIWVTESISRCRQFVVFYEQLLKDFDQ